jgi:hypothetical protein
MVCDATVNETRYQLCRVDAVRNAASCLVCELARPVNLPRKMAMARIHHRPHHRWRAARSRAQPRAHSSTHRTAPRFRRQSLAPRMTLQTYCNAVD